MDASYSSHPEYQRRTVSLNEAIFPPSPGWYPETDRNGALGAIREPVFFCPGHSSPGISLWEDEFSDFADYAHKAGGAERGGAHEGNDPKVIL